MDNKKRDSSIRTGAGAAGKAAKLGAKGAKKLFDILPPTAKLWVLCAACGLILISAIASLLSVPQADNALSMTAEGEKEINTPLEEDKEKSLWDKEYTKEKTEEFLEIIADYEKEDEEERKGDINSYCIKHGYSTEESLKHLSISKKQEDEIKQENTKTVIRSFSLSELREKSLTKYPYTSQVTDGVQKKILNKAKKDENGLYRYEAGEGMEDILVLMPTSYGKDGSRFLLTLNNGKEYTLIKAGSIEKKKTYKKEGYELKEGGIFSIVVDTSIIAKKYKKAKDLYPLFESKISSLSLIESEYTGDSLNMTSTGERVFAAFSVYMDNGQLIKNEDGSYVNQGGNMAVGQDKKIDYSKELKKALKKYLNNGGHFYEVDYERDEDGKIYVRTKVWYTTTTEINDKTGEKKTRRVRHESRYVHPILIELDLDSIAEEIFDIDPDAMYINSGANIFRKEKYESKSQITNAEAIDSILAATRELLFDSTTTMTDAIYLSERGGSLEWPAPGINSITSSYGSRMHPILKRWIKHEGLDLGAPEGSVVVSAEDGVVTTAGWYGGYGNYIEIDHGNGLRTRYAHLKTVGVSTGDKVVRGQHIAYSGNTGRSTGAHLHFEVCYNGHTQDPLPYIQ